MGIKFVANSTLGGKFPIIADAIDAAVDGYTFLVTKRDYLVNKLEIGMQKIDNFLK